MRRFVTFIAALFINLVSGQEECPPPDSLGPCLCFPDNNGVLALRCSAVSSGEDLAQIFTDNEFSFLGSVDIISSPDLNGIPTETFGTTAIGALRFYFTGLTTLSPTSFSAETADSIHSLYIKHNSAFMELDYSLPGGLPALESLYVSFNGLDILEGFLDPTSLPLADFSHNQINSIAPGYFLSATNLTVLLLPFNQLSEGSLLEGSLAINNPNGDLYIDLAFNQLTQGVPLEVFTEGHVPRELILSGNNITTLSEERFYPLMKHISNDYAGEGYILLDHNFMSCECDMAWLLDATPEERAVLLQAECIDGRLVEHLTNEDFSNC